MFLVGVRDDDDLSNTKIKIIDFNVSKLYHTPLLLDSRSSNSDDSSKQNDCDDPTKPIFELQSTRVGTPMYRPPEFMRLVGALYTQAVDLWGLGCVIYTLLTGDDPFDYRNG